MGLSWQDRDDPRREYGGDNPRPFMGCLLTVLTLIVLSWIVLFGLILAGVELLERAWPLPT